MGFFEFEGKIPTVAGSCYIDDTAVIIGDVEIGENCFIGPGAKIKGDYGRIIIGEGSSIQDNCVVHVRPKYETVVGSHVTVGHGAILHGAKIGDYTVVGMGAIIPDFTEVGEYCVVAEGSVIASGTNIPAKSVVMGVPGKVKAKVDEEMEEYCRANAEFYQDFAQRCRKNLKKIPIEQVLEPKHIL
ncbi:MAG: gamma carbonic anhydrase family protein [Actinobacteria bacterium]|nr:gamma carbonic anhydrase family protein [Actinomycetota bacterium]